MPYMTPIDAYRQSEQFKAEQQSNALSNMFRQTQVNAAQRQMQDQEAFRQAMSGAVSPNGDINYSGLIPAMARTGNLEGLLKMKQIQEANEQKNVLRDVLAAQIQPKQSMTNIAGDTTGSTNGSTNAVTQSQNSSIPGASTPRARSNTYQKYLAVADELSRRGMGEAAKPYYDLAEKFRPELKDQKILVQGGKRIVVNYFKDGTSEIQPYDPDAEKLHFIETGGRAGVGIDPFTGKQMSAGMQRTMTPGEIATNARMMESQAMARQERNDARGQRQWVYDSQRGLAINPITGEARPITQNGVGIGMKKGDTTEDERKAASWFAQADNAYKNIQEVMAESPGVESPGVLEAAMKSMPKFTGMPGAVNAVMSGKRQRFTQAINSYAEAVLRAATGAGITRDEAAGKVDELTPKYWDTDETKKQKLDSLKIYLDAIKLRAGRALEQAPQSPNDFVVNLPDGRLFKFPTRQQADAYKKAAGIP